MTEDAHQIESGDWFVHAHFGAGCVKGHEVKAVGEQEQNYYELETAVCTLWLPEEQLFGQKIRPVTDQTTFQQVINVLKGPSKEMSSDANKRKLRIKEVKTANAPADTASLVRDLWVREQAEGKLYDWERQAWRELCILLIQEWALSLEISGEEARHQIGDTLTKEKDNSAAQGASGAEANNSNESRSLLDSVAADERKWSTWRDETAH
jgi:RNA polymerase-interacting CarD/CdnL/TRCF family regulator